MHNLGLAFHDFLHTKPYYTEQQGIRTQFLRLPVPGQIILIWFLDFLQGVAERSAEFCQYPCHTFMVTEIIYGWNGYI